jgi:hypothetical protein
MKNPISKDTSIEYAHIYTNNKIDKEHHLSVEILEELYKQEKKKSHSISLVVLVDDYSFSDPSFDYNEFSFWLGEKGFKPDLIIRESQLIPLCDQVLNISSDSKLKEQISDYIRAKKYPCSLFVASWYLLRLGYITAPFFDKNQTAKKIINILPLSFKPFEDQAIEIIESTEFASTVKQIEWKYFEGRLVA